MNHRPWNLCMVFLLIPLMSVAQYNDLVLKVRVSDTNGSLLAYPMVKLVDRYNPTRDAYHLLGNGKGVIEQRLTSVPGDARDYAMEVIAEGHRTEYLRLDASILDLTSHTSAIWQFEMDIRMRPGAAKPDGDGDTTRCWYVRDTNEFRCEGRVAKGITIERSHDPDLEERLVRIAMEDVKTGVMVYGYVRDHWSNAGITPGEVHILPQDSPGADTVVHTNEFGFYAFTLGYDQVVHLKYTADGMVAKTLVLDLLNIPEADREGGYGTNIDVRLFGPIPGEDLSFLDKPMGYARYVPENDMIEWDHALSTPVIQRLDEIMRRNRKR